MGIRFTRVEALCLKKGGKCLLIFILIGVDLSQVKPSHAHVILKTKRAGQKELCLCILIGAHPDVSEICRGLRLVSIVLELELELWRSSFIVMGDKVQVAKFEVDVRFTGSEPRRLF